MTTMPTQSENLLDAGTIVVETAHETDNRSKTRATTRRFLINALIWCSLAALLVMSALNISAIRAYPDISLRYKTPVSGQTAWQARQFAASQSGDDVFWPTFWHETQAKVSGDFTSTKALCVYYSGDAGLVFPATYINGTAPGVTDGVGCAVSSALAWKLWGSYDIVGKEVVIDSSGGADGSAGTVGRGGIEGLDGIGGADSKKDEVRTVRGVFESTDLAALLSVRDEDKNYSYTAVELSGGPYSPDRNAVERFTAASGLGNPDVILLGTPAFLAETLSALPLLILAIYAVIQLAIWAKKHPAASKGALFIALIAGAALLPLLLNMLPDWIIPNRWSDFSFWGTLFSRLGEDLREYLALEPRLRDVTYKTLLLKQLGITFAAIISALIVCFLESWRLFRQLTMLDD